VTLPETDTTLKVRVRITPAGLGFDADLLTFEGGIATFALSGELITSRLRYLQEEVEKLPNLKGLVLDLTNLKCIGNTGWNYLLFTKQRAGANFTVKLTNLSEVVKNSLLEAELDEEFTIG
ncbi:MAG: N-acyl-D-glucosamine 2-epimerase, partial [Proteobacteria bacterium]|nr:N-acyl-D-glucosamine 2-epimerase [Pseudomonadota bacterium]